MSMKTLVVIVMVMVTALVVVMVMVTAIVAVTAEVMLSHHRWMSQAGNRFFNLEEGWG